ncbi:hypothetical protein [Streptomyces sp. NPDC059783]|uniref:hypothetical protein n=1 Tax=Streptomyces sp. NPDC059783 TaxID=3346944 RepID=UPI003657E57C
MTALFAPQRPERGVREVALGAVHVPDWLTLEQQQWITGQFHEWVQGPVPLRAAKVRGHEMSVRTVCLGWHWQPYRYTREGLWQDFRRRRSMRCHGRPVRRMGSL